MKTTFDTVRDIVAKQAGWRFEDGAAPALEIRPESTLIEYIGLDSIDHIEVTLALEEDFGISITDDEMETLLTVADIVALVDRKTIEQAA